MSAISESTEVAFYEPIEKESETSSVSRAFFNALDTVYPKNPYTKEREIQLIPKVVEGIISFIATSEIDEEGALYEDHPDLPVCNAILEKFLPNTHRDLPFEVVIGDTGVINAMAYPDGRICINRGLLDKVDRFIEDPLSGYTDPKTGAFYSYKGVQKKDILAALIGHEIIHIDARHTMHGIEIEATGSKVLTFLECVGMIKLYPLLGMIGTIVTACVAATIAQTLFSIYCQSKATQQEFEADIYGLQHAYNAGFNPHGALCLQDILRNDEMDILLGEESTEFMKGLIKVVEWFFEVIHPPYNERQQALLTEITRLNAHDNALASMNIRSCAWV